MTDKRPDVVILGAGFGGLEAAKALRRAPVNVTVIDQQNHHCFQPLLYQVATAALSPPTSPGRSGTSCAVQQNATVLMAEVIGVGHCTASSADALGRHRLRLTGRRHRRDPFLFRS